MKKFSNACVASAIFSVMLLAVGGCASSGPATPPLPPGPVATVHSAAQTVDFASQTADHAAGPVTKVLQAIGLAKRAPTSYLLPLRLFTSDRLNAGRGTQSLAVVLKVYHLRSVDAFQRAPFNDFLDDARAKADLGDALVYSREMLLLPGQRYDSTERLSAQAHYIGFVALFRGPAAHRWKFSYEVPESTKAGITLGIHACAMTSTTGALVTRLVEPADSLATVHCPRVGS